MPLLVDNCGCITPDTYTYDALTEYIIAQYQLANMPQPERIYKAWDYAIKMRRSLDYEMTEDSSSFTANGITCLGHVRVVKAVFVGNQVYIKSQFTQVGNLITMTNGAVFANGELITLEFEYD